MAEVSDMRKPYHGVDNIFDVKDLSSKEPMKQFLVWFEDVKKDKTVMEPNAMAIATATKSGLPSVRMVLLKGYTDEGFIFYSNYESRKAKELEENPNCALMFYWEHLKRSIRVEGTLEKISEEGSTQYFNSRPRASRLGAVVSHQSTVIANRQVLDDRNAELQEQYKDEATSIPRPQCWGGYLVRPHVFEFWQGQTNRLHDRLRFRKLSDGETYSEELMVKAEGDWVIERLSP